GRESHAVVVLAAEAIIGKLLEAAGLVRRVEAGEALRFALVLDDLDERLHRRAPPRGLGGERRHVRAFDAKHATRAQVRVVGDGEDVAAGARVEAGAVKARP